MAILCSILLFFLCCFFFFSSRRRHTRFDCDWSSDVCSSDLGPMVLPEPLAIPVTSRVALGPDGIFLASTLPLPRMITQLKARPVTTLILFIDRKSVV